MSFNRSLLGFALVLPLSFTLFSCAAAAQTTTPAAATTPTAATTPAVGSMFVDVGEAYNHYVAPATYATELDFGVRLAGTNFFSISTLDLQPSVATMRTGIGYLIKKSGPVSIFATMDGGVTSTSGTPSGLTLGNVGGGVRVRYDLGSKWPKLAGLGVIAGIRETAIAGSSVSPEGLLGLSYLLK